MTGRLYHRYSKQVIPFVSGEQAVFLMEQLFDSLQFPYPSTLERSFSEELKSAPTSRQERLMNDEDLLSRHGDLGSFIVRVQHRQNSSWQGTLTWMERDKTVHFRSIWEMIKLVESALNENGSMENSSEPSWSDSNG
ncbi:MAG: hypothetical protein HFF83_05660 [Oscillibacter sp.]|jgi:hypothetical protein|nr:hypothetical protein [Oscillibacter sp.]